MSENPPDPIPGQIAEAINRINKKRFTADNGEAHIVEVGPTMVTIFPPTSNEPS